MVSHCAGVLTLELHVRWRPANALERSGAPSSATPPPSSPRFASPFAEIITASGRSFGKPIYEPPTTQHASRATTAAAAAATAATRVGTADRDQQRRQLQRAAEHAQHGVLVVRSPKGCRAHLRHAPHFPPPHRAPNAPRKPGRRFWRCAVGIFVSQAGRTCLGLQQPCEQGASRPRGSPERDADGSRPNID